MSSSGLTYINELPNPNPNSVQQQLLMQQQQPIINLFAMDILF